MDLFKTTGLRWLWVAAVVLVLDQLSKLAILDAFRLYESVEVMPFFNLTYVQNKGAAFSFLASAGGWQRYFFAAIAAFAVGLLSYWLYQTPKSKRLLPIGYAMILGGALGNLYDRIAYGYVVDFLDFYVGIAHYPAFNIADAGIVCGAIIVMYDAFTGDKKESEQQEINKTNV